MKAAELYAPCKGLGLSPETFARQRLFAFLDFANREVQSPTELQAKVEQAAVEYKSGADEYVKQLVEHYLDLDTWFRQQIKHGLEQLDRGEFLTHEEVGSRIEGRFRS